MLLHITPVMETGTVIFLATCYQEFLHGMGISNQMKVVMIAIDEMTILGDKFSNDHNDCHRHQDKVSHEMTAKKTRVCFVYKTTYCLFPHFCHTKQ